MVLKNFIVFEGIDGAGTSTQIKIFADSEYKDKMDFSAEPTSNETGKFLRKMLKGDIQLDPRTSAYLFAADRAEHIWGKDGIEEKCRNGKICISDRYLFSSLTYQSVTCGEKLPSLLNSPFPLPEILFFFEIEPEVSLSRIGGRETREIYEKVDFLKATEERYKKIISEFEKKNTGMKIIRINAELPIEKVTEIIMKELEGKLK